MRVEDQHVILYNLYKTLEQKVLKVKYWYANCLLRVGPGGRCRHWGALWVGRNVLYSDRTLNFRDILTWFNSSNYILKIMFHSMYSLLKVKKHPHLFESLGVSLCFWTAVFISPICTYFYSTVEHHNRQQKLFMSILQMPISSSLWIKRCTVQPRGISHICPSC